VGKLSNRCLDGERVGSQDKLGANGCGVQAADSHGQCPQTAAGYTVQGRLDTARYQHAGSRRRAKREAEDVFLLPDRMIRLSQPLFQGAGIPRAPGHADHRRFAIRAGKGTVPDRSRR
jgi:hypothetical protein